MKYFSKLSVFFLFSIFSGLINAQNYKPIINVDDFQKKMNGFFGGEHIYTDVKKNKTENYRQEFYRERDLDLHYSIFNKTVVDYAYYEINNIKNYEYTEIFLNCDNKNKIKHRSIFNSDGKYLSSKIYILSFDDDNSKVNEIVCNEDK